MIIHSIIQKSQLEEANRLDAEYFVANQFFKKYYLGSEIVDFVQYGTSKYLNEDKLGYPILRLNEFENYFIKEPEKFCDLITEGVFRNLELKEGDILICRTNGNPKLVGKSAIVMEDKPYAYASYLFRVRTKSEKINSATLLTYLHSSYGRAEIEKNMMISNQTNFSPARFRLIRIPMFDGELQREITLSTQDAYKLSNNAIKFYQQAEDLLLEELGISDFEIPQDLTYVVSFSEFENANRIDSDYFQPKYELLISKIKNQVANNLLEVFQNISPDFKPKSDETYKYVELANINSSIGTIDGFSEVLGGEAPSRAKRILKTGDVITSSVEGSLEKVALVDSEQDGFLASTGFFQFRSSQVLPEVLLVLARSIVFQMQIQKETAGTILTAVPKEAIRNIKVPILSRSIQQKIADLVRKSHEARKKSKQLLEEAKSKVEEMIENGRKN